MKLVKMKALMLGTGVASTLNQLGEVVSGCIIHVDPDNDREEGRYTDPVVTEEAAKKLEEGGYAKRAGTVDFKPGAQFGSVTADVEAERVEEFAGEDHKGPGFGPSGLDTRNSVNFTDGADVVRAGAGGTPTFPQDDADAAPAPAAARPARKPAGG